MRGQSNDDVLPEISRIEPQIRATLYMTALTEARHNPAIRVCYQRPLARGKPKKLALTACIRKLLVTLNVMARAQPPWPHIPVALT